MNIHNAIIEGSKILKDNLMNFIRKIFSPLILLVSVVILIYTFYKSEIIWNGANRIFYNNYYILSIFLFLISILSFYLKSSI